MKICDALADDEERRKLTPFIANEITVFAGRDMQLRSLIQTVEQTDSPLRLIPIAAEVFGCRRAVFQEKGYAVTRWDEKVRVVVGNVSLELPSSLVKRQATPIDSASNVFEGSGVTVIVDQGPFVDRLDSYAGRPEYQEMNNEVAGTASRTISFQNPNRGAYTVATHLPAPKYVTVVIQADAHVPEQVPREIIESLRLLD